MMSQVFKFIDSSKISKDLNPLTIFRIRGGAGQKGPPYQFFPVTSANVGISPENFLTFSFNPIATLV